MPDLYYEDFVPGVVETFNAAGAVTKDDIVAFARQFDPQPFHLDEEAAKASLLGGLSASGWHTCCLVMRLNYDGWIFRTASMGAPGIEEVRWMKPVRPDDRLQLRLSILDKRVSASRPTMGLVSMFGEVSNADGTIVMTQRHTQLVEVRSPEKNGAPASTPSERDPKGAPSPVAGTVAGAGDRCRRRTVRRHVRGYRRRRDAYARPGNVDEGGDRRVRAGLRPAAVPCRRGGGAPQSFRRPLRHPGGTRPRCGCATSSGGAPNTSESCAPRGYRPRAAVPRRASRTCAGSNRSTPATR